MVVEENGGGGRITIGVCVMVKKVGISAVLVFCSPMEQILERLRAFGEFEIIIFGDKVILEDPIEMYVMTTQPMKMTTLPFTLPCVLFKALFEPPTEASLLAAARSHPAGARSRPAAHSEPPAFNRSESPTIQVVPPVAQSPLPPIARSLPPAARPSPGATPPLLGAPSPALGASCCPPKATSSPST
ncbi:hypothetical protein GUJ93_ZPchr0003g16550 [Zizania palustris]|uniref:VIP1 N-terminal domain-containing protein n=1 Tax=Zizania palustris TaxID=103762 RepID=A0A8J5VDQ1_ZIZPA|nr:hypothetical protein GUJ93_ZPchr0003g16550 [Zizania palustris]